MSFVMNSVIGRHVVVFRKLTLQRIPNAVHLLLLFVVSILRGRLSIESIFQAVSHLKRRIDFRVMATDVAVVTRLFNWPLATQCRVVLVRKIALW